MHANEFRPTPYPDINTILHELLANVQAILGYHFVGMYLDGSLTSDAFDAASDIDFIVVSDVEINDAVFKALQLMHERMAAMNSPWAIQLEGAYISQHALRRYDPAAAFHPAIERGQGERLKLVNHNASWVVHRAILRERGITLAGPPPHTLIDPISPDDLRRAMLSMLPVWTAPLLENSALLQARGEQSYIVLSLCRVLYTMRYGRVVSKPVAAQWAQATFGEVWKPLIERALTGRRHPDGEASSDDVQRTLAFIHTTLEHSQRVEVPANEE